MVLRYTHSLMTINYIYIVELMTFTRLHNRHRPLDVSQPTEAEYQQDGADLDWHQEQSGMNTGW